MFTIILLGVIVFLSYLYWYNNKRYSTLPGPWNLPFLGYIHMLDPSAPFLTLAQLSRKYGPIYRIKMGILNTIVISDPKLIKEIFMKDEALERPPNYIVDFISRGTGLVFSKGSVWKDQRKFLVNYLRASGAYKASPKRQILTKKIKNYVEIFIKKVKDQNDNVILDPTQDITNYLTNVASSLFLGRDSADDDQVQDIVSQLDKLMEILIEGGALIFFPVLSFIPKYKKLIKSADEIYQEIHRIIDGIINQNYNKSEENIINAFQVQKSKSNSEEIYTMEQLRTLIGDLFGATMETTLNSILWILLYLATYKNVQSRVREELFNVLQGKSPEMDDLSKLPYLEATLAEVARIRTPGPLGLFRYSTDDFQIDDFKIPKNSMLIALLWGVHMDPTVWKDPELFSPERFLDKIGMFCQSESFLPFQAGKRKCVGEDFARMLIFLFVAGVVQNFEIDTCDSGPADLTYNFKMSLVPKRQPLIFKRIS